MSQEKIKELISNIGNHQVAYSRSKPADPSASFKFDISFKNHEDCRLLREIIEFDKQANHELFAALHDPARFAIAHVLLISINGWRLGGHISVTLKTEGHYSNLPFQIGEDDKLTFPKSGIPEVVAFWERSNEVFGLFTLEDEVISTEMSAAENPSPRFTRNTRNCD